MIELNVQQGTPEWHAARAKCFNASEAPAMMGVSPYMTRSQLLHQKKTGIQPEHDAATLQRFDDGHEAEAKARAIVESMIAEDLYPVVATDEAGRLLASSDGATMLYDTGFEHKLWNEEIAAQVRAGEVPDSHKWQLDQQIAVFGFERIIFVCSDGTEANFAHCEYRTTPERIARLMAGWEQFERDLAEYVPEAPKADAPIGHAPEALPALRIEVTGMVTASNLEAFRAHALAVFQGIKTDLQTDADFADAEKTVKWCKEVEDKLDGAKQHALSQTASIDHLFSTIDAIKEEARAVRLKLDKLVKSEKEARKLQIVTQAQHALVAHVAALNERLGGNYMPAVGGGPFGEAVKGLKSLDSMRDKVGAALANAKIDASAMADRIEANRKAVEDMSLVPDFAQVCAKAPDDFAALLAMRVNARREAEERRLAAERERIQAQEQAKAQREAQEKARAEQARVERLQDYLEGIREYLPEAVSICKNAAEVRESIEHLTAREITPEIYQEFYDQAVKLKADTLAAMEKVFAERAEREAADAARIVQAAPVTPTQPAAQPAAEPTPAPAESAATITLGQINAQIAPIQISAAGLTSLGIQSVGRDRSAVLYRESDIGRICSALIRHLSTVSGRLKQAA